MKTNHVFTFNPVGLCSDQLILHTSYEVFEDSGELEVYGNQELILNCNENSVHLNIPYLLTPDKLRQLADQLEVAHAKALTSFKN